jgi:hypothetical protein
MKKYLIIYLFLSASFATAQITDSITMPFQVKFNLHQNLNEGKMLNLDGNEVDYLKQIKKSNQFKEKGTLLIHWAAYDSNSKKIIDTLLSKKLYNKYNIVLINGNMQKKDLKLIKETKEKFPLYTQFFTCLFDSNNIFRFNDNGVTPLLFWLDKDFKLVTATLPINGITSNDIEAFCLLVNSKKIVPSNIRFFKKGLLPSTKEEAELKLIFSETGNAANLKLVVIKTEQSYYDLNFIKNNKGDYFYVKTQNEIKREITKKETINTIIEILGSLKGVKFRAFLGGSITEYDFKGSAMNYKVISGAIEVNYKYSYIYWDKLTSTAFKKKMI